MNTGLAFSPCGCFMRWKMVRWFSKINQATPTTLTWSTVVQCNQLYFNFTRLFTIYNRVTILMGKILYNSLFSIFLNHSSITSSIIIISIKNDRKRHFSFFMGYLLPRYLYRDLTVYPIICNLLQVIVLAYRI